MYKRILVPLDGSELAERALPYAEGLAKKYESDVILLNTFLSTDRLEDSLEMYIEGKAKELQSLGIKASSLHIHGNAATEIINFAEKNSIGLIVMSSHGCTGDRCWALGGIAHKVLQRSTVPTLLTRADHPDALLVDKDLRKILVALDGSQVAEAILPYAESLAKEMGSELVLLEVVEPVVLPHTFDYRDREKYEQSLIAKAKRYLNERESALRGKGVKVSSVLLRGKPAQTILQYAEDNSVSLVALTTHGFSGIAKWAYGSVAFNVVEICPRPILLVRPLLSDK